VQVIPSLCTRFQAALGSVVLSGAAVVHLPTVVQRSTTYLALSAARVSGSGLTIPFHSLSEPWEVPLIKFNTVYLIPLGY